MSLNYPLSAATDGLLGSGGTTTLNIASRGLLSSAVASTLRGRKRRRRWKFVEFDPPLEGPPAQIPPPPEPEIEIEPRPSLALVPMEVIEAPTVPVDRIERVKQEQELQTRETIAQIQSIKDRATQMLFDEEVKLLRRIETENRRRRKKKLKLLLLAA